MMTQNDPALTGNFNNPLKKTYPLKDMYILRGVRFLYGIIYFFTFSFHICGSAKPCTGFQAFSPY